MSKAEDLAKELFPLLETYEIGNNPYITYNTEQLAKQEGFVKGYRQAEKNLELTWEDIRKIVNIYEIVLNDKDFNTLPIKDGYTEVLKRFKESKGE